MRTVDGTIIVTHQHGRMAASGAEGELRKARSQLSDFELMIKACNRSLEFEELPEVVAQLKDRRDAHAEKAKAMKAHMAELEKVPQPVLNEKRIRL